MAVPNDALGRWVKAHYSTALEASVYRRLKASGFVPPPAAGPNPPPPLPPADAPPAAYSAPTPTNLEALAGIANTQAEIGALPALYNPQRRALAANTARGLTDAGLYEDTPNLLEEFTSGSNVAFRPGRGFEGRAFRDARTGIASQFNNLGTFFSSARGDAQRGATVSLNNSREQALRQWAAQQDDLTTGQARQAADLTRQLGSQRGAYADWQASQTVPTPPPVYGGPSQGAPSGFNPSGSRTTPRPPTFPVAFGGQEAGSYRPTPIPGFTGPGFRATRRRLMGGR